MCDRDGVRYQTRMMNARPPRGNPARRAASVPRRALLRLDADALTQKQGAFDLQPVLATTPGVAAVAADRAVGGDDAVAGDEQADRIPSDGATDRAGRSRRADPSCDLAVARRRAPRDLGHGAKDIAVPDGTVSQVDRQSVNERPAGEKILECRDPGRQGSVWPIIRRVDAAAEAPTEPRLERLLGRQPVDRDDAAAGRSDEERTPRTGDGAVDGDRISHRRSLAYNPRWYTPREYD